MRKKDPKSTALIFKTGKIVLLGAKSIAEIKTAAQKFAKDITKVMDKHISL